MAMLLPYLTHHDERVLHLVVLRRRRFFDRLMGCVTHLGDAAFVVPVLVILLVGLPLGERRAAMAAAFALSLSHGLVQLLKRSVTRPRPRLPVGVLSLIDAPDRFSFPSGHAAAALSVALPFSLTLPLAFAVGLVALAVLVGTSRCYLGVHYPSDVVAGWILAGLSLWAAAPALAWLGFSLP